MQDFSWSLLCQRCPRSGTGPKSPVLSVHWNRILTGRELPKLRQKSVILRWSPWKDAGVFNVLSMWDAGSDHDCLHCFSPTLPELKTERPCRSVGLSGKECNTWLVMSALVQLAEIVVKYSDICHSCLNSFSKITDIRKYLAAL